MNIPAIEIHDAIRAHFKERRKTEKYCGMQIKPRTRVNTKATVTSTARLSVQPLTMSVTIDATTLTHRMAPRTTSVRLNQKRSQDDWGRVVEATDSGGWYGLFKAFAERDNGYDHRAGTEIIASISTRKSGFACIVLLSRVFELSLAFYCGVLHEQSTHHRERQ